MDDGEAIGARRRADGTLALVLPVGSTLSLAGDTDWPRLLAISDDEIEANAATVPDDPLLSPDELARMRLVSEPREIRRRLRPTQEAFAARFGVPLALLAAATNSSFAISATSSARPVRTTRAGPEGVSGRGG